MDEGTVQVCQVLQLSLDLTLNLPDTSSRTKIVDAILYHMAIIDILVAMVTSSSELRDLS